MNIIEELQKNLPNYIHVDVIEPETPWDNQRVLASAFTKDGMVARAFTHIPDALTVSRSSMIRQVASELEKQFKQAGGDYIPVPKCKHGVNVFDASIGCVICVVGVAPE
jgi:hypothetical protein